MRWTATPENHLLYARTIGLDRPQGRAAAARSVPPVARVDRAQLRVFAGDSGRLTTNILGSRTSFAKPTFCQPR
jgi:hypothetical protein